MGVNITRRGLLAGTGLLGAGGLVALAGCAATPAEPSRALGDTGQGGDWLGAPPELAPEDCFEKVSADVVIVGAGLSGSLAAFAAVDEGADVVVLDKHKVFHYGGNGVSFVNSQTQLNAGAPRYDETELLYRLFNDMQNRVDLSLYIPWVYQSGHILDELVEKVLDPFGVPFRVDADPGAYLDVDVQLNGRYATGVVFCDPAVDNIKQLIDAVQDYVESQGGRFVYSMRGEKVVQDETGRACGVIATGEDGNPVLFEARKGVLVCTGSYGANEAMVREYYAPGIQELFRDYDLYPSYYAADEAPAEPLDTGDGHKMLCWAGAVMEEKTHPFCGWPISGPIGTPYLQVNQCGRRFMNEATAGLNSLQIAAEQPREKGFYTWQIVTDEGVEMPNTVGVPKEVIELFIANGETIEADTIESLAEQMEVDPKILSETVTRYNQCCADKFDADFAKKAEYLVPVETPPFKAVRVRYGVAVTMGGVRTNSSLQVLDKDDVPIPGLYAAGHTVGHRFGWAYESCNGGMTNSLAMTHGYVAGKHCANL
ncbi:FAD-dependent oxidoreductase [Adlercreutzia sp. R21]|uniref:FAD-dependent oxidoreductase n=1 Tax=Adlercreutzia wanghongyangiae TaxID=3111451 RepID=UPI002DB6DE09|nr:FAD-dependent oxidoreductase [Adlercreutzia sp. R21]MEC4183461.1 FAD-dependent oxidoreductase [Adlercreutzia sp. R21]